MGGGPANTISLLELLDVIERLNGKKPEVTFDSWRSADQRYYVSDTRKFAQATGWRTQVDTGQGISSSRTTS
jgi:CDP-paratose 2-epimerase